MLQMRKLRLGDEMACQGSGLNQELMEAAGQAGAWVLLLSGAGEGGCGEWRGLGGALGVLCTQRCVWMPLVHPSSLVLGWESAHSPTADRCLGP